MSHISTELGPREAVSHFVLDIGDFARRVGKEFHQQQGGGLRDLPELPDQLASLKLLEAGDDALFFVRFRQHHEHLPLRLPPMATPEGGLIIGTSPLVTATSTR